MKEKTFREGLKILAGGSPAVSEMIRIKVVLGASPRFSFFFESNTVFDRSPILAPILQSLLWRLIPMKGVKEYG